MVSALMAGCVISAYYWVDTSESCVLTALRTACWALDTFPDQLLPGAVCDMFTMRDVQGISREWLGEIGTSLCVMGSPCQGFSGINKFGKRGLDHPGSGLLVDGLAVMLMAREVQEQRGGEFWHIFENVKGFQQGFKDICRELEDICGVKGRISDSALVGASRRARYWNTNISGVPWPTVDEGDTWEAVLQEATGDRLVPQIADR